MANMSQIKMDKSLNLPLVELPEDLLLADRQGSFCRYAF